MPAPFVSIKFWLCVFIICAACVLPARAQETVFDVPSADILDRGKVYGELDFSYQHSTNTFGVTPRFVIGTGKRIEVGMNLNGISTFGVVQTTFTPTFKWKAYDGGENGWAILAGDNIFLPAQNRSYNAGNYVYAEFAKSWKTGTRVTAGAFHFTKNVVASAQRAGGQFAFEQTLNKRLTFATDWLTGGHTLGYVTPGLVFKLTSKVTLYGCYQLGNRGLTDGNHQLLAEIGWNFN